MTKAGLKVNTGIVVPTRIRVELFSSDPLATVKTYCARVPLPDPLPVDAPAWMQVVYSEVNPPIEWFELESNT